VQRQNGEFLFRSGDEDFDVDCYGVFVGLVPGIERGGDGGSKQLEYSSFVVGFRGE